MPEAPTPADTDWREIVGLYDLLLRITPSPIIALNRTVAVAQLDGPETGLQHLDDLLAGGELEATSSRTPRAPTSCAVSVATPKPGAPTARAIELTEQGPAKRFLEKRVADLPS